MCISTRRRRKRRGGSFRDGCVENLIARAIFEGRVRFARGVALIDGDGWQATAVRTEGVLRPRPRAWRVTAITRTPTRTEE